MAEVNKYSDKTLGNLEQMFQDSKAKETTAEKQTANLNQASQAAYQQTQLENEQAQNRFAQNTMANQMSALDAIRKSNASAIANGANAGLSAANQLSSILGLQETTNEEATKLANADIDAAAQLNTQLNENAIKGQQMADDLNVKLGANQAEIGKAMAEIEKAQAQVKATQISADAQADLTKAQTDKLQMEMALAEQAKYDKFLNNYLSKINDETEFESYYDAKTGTVRSIYDLSPEEQAWLDRFSEVAPPMNSKLPATKEEAKQQIIAQHKKATGAEMKAIIQDTYNSLNKAYAAKDAEAITKYKTILDNLTKLEYNKPIAKEEEEECLAPGTLITMADGSFKKVEDIQGGDLVQVWDFVNGSINVSAVLFVEHREAQIHQVMTLTFSDATQVRIIDDHGFFDLDLMKFVYIQHPSDADKYVGHFFLKSDGTGTYPVRLTGIEITEENISTHSPCTICDLCLFANGMLSMPGATESFTNYFKISPKTLKYSKRDMKQSFRKYGVCSYDDFEDILPEYYFKVFNGELLNIGIGKGITTKEDILKLINRYSQYLK